jgi:hypothetical protein
MRTFLLAVALATLSSPAFAQTHFCDQVPANNPNVDSPVKFSFCVLQTDVAKTSGYKIYLDTNPTPIFNGPLAPIGTPSATGFVQIGPTPPILVPSGPHSAAVTALSLADSITGIVDETVKSTAYPFVVIALPAVPGKLRIVP